MILYDKWTSAIHILLRRMFAQRYPGSTPEAEREFVWKWSSILEAWEPIITEGGKTK